MKNYMLLIWCSVAVLSGCSNSKLQQKKANDTLIVKLYPAFISYSKVSIIRNSDSSTIDLKLYNNDGYKMRNIYSKSARLENRKTDSLWRILNSYKFSKIGDGLLGNDGMTVYGEFKNGSLRKFSFWSAGYSNHDPVMNELYKLVGISFKDKMIIKYLKDIQEY